MKKITALLSLFLALAPFAVFSDIPVLDMRSPLQTYINIRNTYVPENHQVKFLVLCTFLMGGLVVEHGYVGHVNKTIGTVVEKKAIPTLSDDTYHSYYTPKKGCGHHRCEGTNYNKWCDYAKNWKLDNMSVLNKESSTYTTRVVPYQEYNNSSNKYGVGETGADGLTLTPPKTIDGITYTEGRFESDPTANFDISQLAANYHYKKVHNMDLTQSYICKRWGVCIAGTAVGYILYAGLIKGVHALYRKLRPITKNDHSSQDTEKFDTESAVAQSIDTATENSEVIKDSKKILNNF